MHADISSSEEFVASNLEPALSNPASSVDTCAGDRAVKATIHPAMLTQRYVSSDIPLTTPTCSNL